MKNVEDLVKLEQGDIVKFGRVRFRIKKLYVTIGTQKTAIN